MLSRFSIPVLALFLVAVAGPVHADDALKAKKKAVPAAKAKSAVDATPRKKLRRPAPKSLSEALRRLAHVRVDVDFREMSLSEAVRFIGEVADFNVIVGPELQRDQGEEGLPKITLKLRNATLKQVADLVARFTNTKMAYSGGILSFTTPEAARGKPVLRIYSIGDITAPIRNFPGPDMNLRPSGAEFEPEEESEVENALGDPQNIVDMLQELVETQSWEDEGVSIWSDDRKLVIRQYPQVHRKIARLLSLLRAAR